MKKNPIVIRKVRKNDSDALEDLLALVNGEKYRKLAKEYIQCMFSKDYRRPTFMIAVESRKIIGAAAFSRELFAASIWGISWVSVHPEKRNRKLGQKLVESCLEKISGQTRQTVTVVLAIYPGKTGLYDKVQFEKPAVDHDGGFLMTKTLKARKKNK